MCAFDFTRLSNNADLGNASHTKRSLPAVRPHTPEDGGAVVDLPRLEGNNEQCINFIFSMIVYLITRLNFKW
jgi:hypothetical protein